MSRRNKLEKFAELLSFPNVYQNYSFKEPILRHLDGDIVDRKGCWAGDHFKNENSIVLELACGWGEYTRGLAKLHADVNFIGIDIKGNRIWKGAKVALEENLTNVAFLRTRIELVEAFFERGEVSEMWITFPDPFLRKSKSNRRLTAMHFLEKYTRVIIPGGKLHLKTDSPELYDFTLEEIAGQDIFDLRYHHDDIYSLPALPHPALSITTKYEKMHLAAGRSIKYIQIAL